MALRITLLCFALLASGAVVTNGHAAAQSVTLRVEAPDLSLPHLSPPALVSPSFQSPWRGDMPYILTPLVLRRPMANAPRIRIHDVSVPRVSDREDEGLLESGPRSRHFLSRLIDQVRVLGEFRRLEIPEELLSSDMSLALVPRVGTRHAEIYAVGAW